MRKMIIWTCLLALAATTLMAQEEKSSGFSIAFKNNPNGKLLTAATATFFGKPSGEVWSATVRMLISNDWHIMIVDRISGFVSARMELSPDIWRSFFIEDTPDGASIFFVLSGTGSVAQKKGEDICSWIADQLPSKTR